MTEEGFTETFEERPWKDDPGSDAPPPGAPGPAVSARRESLMGRLLSFEAFMGQEDVPSEDMLGPFIARGHRLLVAADTGHGKSTWCTWATRSMTLGTPFLKSPSFKGILPGWMEWNENGNPVAIGDPYRVLVIDCEQSQRSVKRQLEGAGLGKVGDSHYWRIAEGLDLARDGVDRDVVGEVLTELRPDVVLIDPLFKLHRGNPNDSEVAAQVMAAVDFWRDQLRFGLIIPVHVRKQPSMNGKATRDLALSDVHGAATWTWGAEVIIGLERRREAREGVGMVDRTYLRWFKDREGDLFETTWELTFGRETGFHRAPQSKTAGRLPQGRTVDRLKQYLEEESGKKGNVDKWWSISELTEALGFKSRDPVDKALQALIGFAKEPEDHPDHWPLLMRPVPFGRTIRNEFRYAGAQGQSMLPAVDELRPKPGVPGVPAPPPPETFGEEPVVDERVQFLGDLGMDDEDLGGI